VRTRAMIVTLVLTAAALAGSAVARPPSASAESTFTTPTAAPAPTAAPTAAPNPTAAPTQTAPAQNCAKSHGTLVAYGHSYLHSPGIGGAKASYVTLAAGALGMQPVIRAVDHATTQVTEGLIRTGPTHWVPGSAELVVIDSGINDILGRVPTAQWTASLRRSLEAFVAPPVPTILLVRPLRVARIGHPGADPKVIAAYAAAQAGVAGQFSAVRIVDASDGWQTRTDLGPDGVHPTPAGEAHLAAAVVGTARGLSCRS
jgi:lysophospholipase L1-like esterase